VETNSCGTFFAFMYFWIAVLPGVPSELKISRTSSSSTSLRACSTVFAGL
jgi:molybdopterin-biosynthesis enzyme MoeA-like protein